MNTLPELEYALRLALPEKLQNYAGAIALIISHLDSGVLSDQEAQRLLKLNPFYQELFRSLSGKQISTAKNIVDFGRDNNFGDVTIRDVIGGNQYNLAFHLNYDDSIQRAKRLEGITNQEILIYDSNQEISAFRSWTFTTNKGGIGEHVQTHHDTITNGWILELYTYETETAGGNKPFPVIKGRVEYEYKVNFSLAQKPNIYFAMIPIKEGSDYRGGLVGAVLLKDSSNTESLAWKKDFIPVDQYGDNKWHKESMAFDFRDVPSTLYSIFAPRINEDLTHKGSATILVRNVKAFTPID